MLKYKKQLTLILCAAALAFCSHYAYRKRDALFLSYSIGSSKPKWVKDQLGSDFEPFSEISQEALDKTFEKITSHKIHAYRYRIVDGTIYRMGDDHSSNRAPVFDKMLKRLNKSRKLPNIDCIVCMMDGVPEVYVPQDFWVVDDPKKQAPLLAWAKKKSAPYIILIPDVLTTIENSWQHQISLIEKTFKTLPWEVRSDKAFWRGTSSDKFYTWDNYNQKPRFLISEISKRHPESVDAGFCKANEQEFTDFFEQIGLLKGNAPIDEHLQYKYLPVLDGWMCTYPGYQWRLLSGSLSMKQESDEVQYFYSALKPYLHYVPVKNDMSDLLEKIEWANGHDSVCKQIAINAQTFARENLMPNQIYTYLYWALKRYASYQNFDTKTLDMSDPRWKRV